MIEGLRAIAFLALVCLPGVWLSSLLKAAPPVTMLLMSVVFSPIVIAVQFYVLRYCGVPFSHIPAWLIGVNLCAVALCRRAMANVRLPGRRATITILLALAIPAVSLLPQFVHQTRAYFGNPWLYGDAAYLVARGDLVLEDPELAGVRLCYPVWAGVVYQSLLSYTLDSPPVYNFIWTNLVWLVVSCGLAVLIVAELGGGYVAQWSAGIWLLFSSNAAGYVLKTILPSAITGRFFIWGDDRYTPWLVKFHDFNSMPLVLGMCLGLVYLLLHRRTMESPGRAFVLTAVLVGGIGVLYPILLPAALAIAGAKIAAVVLEWRRTGSRGAVGIALIAALAVSVAVSAAHYAFLTHDRAAPAPITLYAPWTMLRKTVEFCLVLSPLLAGLALTLRRLWTTRKDATIVLVLGALGSALLAIPFHIRYFENEYKFVFTAVICVAPFAALATETVLREARLRRAWPALAAIFAALFFVYWDRMNRWAWDFRKPWPAADASGFHLRLAAQEKFAGVCDALRRLTPPDTVVALDNSERHYPMWTSRSLYVPAASALHVGVNLITDELLVDIRGYDRALPANRRRVLRGMFDAGEERSSSLRQMLALGRPLAIVVEPRHRGLLDWLEGQSGGSVIYRDRDAAIWLRGERDRKPEHVWIGRN